MLILVAILLIIAGIGLHIFADWCSNIGYESKSNSNVKYFLYYHDELFDIISFIITVISAGLLIIMLLILPFCHIGKNAAVELNNERYKALTYKVESGACRDEFGLLSKEVLDEIQEWNESVMRNKRLQNDFWVGVFVPDIYDELETINYESYTK